MCKLDQAARQEEDELRLKFDHAMEELKKEFEEDMCTASTHCTGAQIFLQTDKGVCTTMVS